MSTSLSGCTTSENSDDVSVNITQQHLRLSLLMGQQVTTNEERSLVSQVQMQTLMFQN